MEPRGGWGSRFFRGFRLIHEVQIQEQENSHKPSSPYNLLILLNSENSRVRALFFVYITAMQYAIPRISK